MSKRNSPIIGDSAFERAEYEAELARGRYEAVDVANRLVALELERRWNQALAGAQQVRREAEEHLRRMLRELNGIERQRILRMSRDVRGVWSAPVVVPTRLSDRERHLLEELRSLGSENPRQHLGCV